MHIPRTKPPSLLQALPEASQLRSVTFSAGTLAEVMAINLIETWMMDGVWIELIGEQNGIEAREDG